MSDNHLSNPMICERVAPFSDEWHQVRELCYILFFQKHGLPRTVLDDGLDEDAHRVCIKRDGRVVASGRITKLPCNWYDVTAMVVASPLQRQGFGAAIMSCLIDIARQLGADGLTLKARTTAKGFYSRFGFVAKGKVFPSAKTGVPHVRMTLSLK
ncbi:MAG: GNAT family N-acetyltransferase [Deltaproteobacteria bacterium]|nr:GNAT family N-acetyltransferase [Deltaproteobacteria bacterium]